MFGGIFRWGKLMNNGGKSFHDQFSVSYSVAARPPKGGEGGHKDKDKEALPSHPPHSH
jgi:hypothetical protein